MQDTTTYRSQNFGARGCLRLCSLWFLPLSSSLMAAPRAFVPFRGQGIRLRDVLPQDSVPGSESMGDEVPGSESMNDEVPCLEI